MEHKYAHRDCRNFAPVDVAKGICHLTKQMVPSDGDACPKFDRIEKCRWCANFTADKGKIEMGMCEASGGKNVPKFIAYPDMVAVTCEMYKAK